MADAKMRSTRFEELRQRAEATHVEAVKVATAAGVQPKTTFDPLAPWAHIWVEAAEDRNFWFDEVTEKATQYMTQIKRSAELLDPGHRVSLPCVQPGAEAGVSSGKGGVSVSTPTAPSQTHKGVKPGIGSIWGQGTSKRAKAGAKKRAAAAAAAASRGPQQLALTNAPHNAESPKGKGRKGKKKDKAQVQEMLAGRASQDCNLWNRSASGCTEPCQNNRRHQCEFCGGGHRGINCDK